MSDSFRKPPQSVEAEAMVLGAMLLDAGAITKAVEALPEEAFYMAAHRKVFRAVLAVFERNAPADIVTVGDELKKTGSLDEVGGMAFLTSLVENVLTVGHIDEHSQLIRDAYDRRRLIMAGTLIAESGFDLEVPTAEVMGLAEAAILDLRRGVAARTGMVHVKGIAGPVLEAAWKAKSDKSRFHLGTATGFLELDERICGLMNGDLIIVAGRPSMGKTSFGMQICSTVASRDQVPVAIFSYEMESDALCIRMFCSEARLSYHRFRSGRLSPDEWVRLAKAAQKIPAWPLWLHSQADTSILQLRSMARRMRAEQGLGLVMVDYIQLINAGKEFRNQDSREREVTAISRQLKAMAMELHCPVMALSQLSRAPETRNHKHPRPQLSDLRESGSLEQDADCVIMLYRDEFYNPGSNRGEAEVIITKQRNGPVGTVKLAFIADHARFENRSAEVPVEEQAEEE